MSTYASLQEQIAKIRRNAVETVSFKTRERYWASFDRFARFCAEKFKLQNIKNIQDKHLLAYIEHLKSQNRSASHIKTELSGIRYVHDLIPNARYKLSGNEKFSLPRRRFGGVDRSWSAQEYQKMREIALEQGNTRAYHILALARHAGMRIEETLKLDRATAEKALRTGILRIKGKGGKIRELPIREEVKNTLREAVANVQRGQKLFVYENEKTHLVKHQMENWLERNRTQAQNPGRQKPSTWHGLRHTYARERYSFHRSIGKSKIEARKAVSAEIGHNRMEVTLIYTGRDDD